MMRTTSPGLSSGKLFSVFLSRSLANRNLALDSFRGIMVLGMILVNHAPPAAAVYPPLVHAPWHGWTLADTIFPGFLFAVGVSISLVHSGANSFRKVTDADVLGRLLRRTVLLMVLNFLLMNFPYYFGGTLLFTGTLSWIAWSYLIASVIALWSGWRAQAGVAFLLLAVQWAAYAWIPLPDASAGTMQPDSNAAREIDRIVLEPVLGSTWKQENEFVSLSLLGAVASTLIGVLAGQWAQNRRESGYSAAVQACAAGVLLLAGAAWHSVFPINKSLWTGSYVLMMAGVSMLLYAALQWGYASLRGRALMQPLRIVGVNALFCYLLAQSFQRLLVYGRLTIDGASIRLRAYLYETCILPWVPGELGALLFALIFLLVCYAVASFMYRRRLFVRL